MAYKKGKNPKNNDRDEQKNPEQSQKKNAISDAFLDELKGAFSNFNKIPESRRTELYGDKEYIEQFWAHFEKEHPNLLDKIDKKDLPVYIQALENKWFSLANIKKNAGKLNAEFKDESTEMHVIEKSLSALQKFCKDANNALPDWTFKKFADATGFDHESLVLSADGKIRILDDLLLVWNKFLEKEGVKLGETSGKDIERILMPDYNPTERMMITVAVAKIKKELKWTLKTAFDAKFPLPLDIFSSCQNLIQFRDEFKNFLDDHASEIDEWLAKKLDSIIVSNGDIKKELLKSWRKFDDTKWFSEQEQYFRRIFNKLVTRQLFEEVQKTQETIDHYITTIGNTFKQFPPYVNDIFSIYPFNDKAITPLDPSFHSDLELIDSQISEYTTQYTTQYTTASDDERKELRKKIKILKQEREQRRWQAYITFLKSKDLALADVFAQLVASKFNFSVLSSSQQQLILNVLVKNKLEDSIKNKVPELLSVNEDEIAQFVSDLFDLKKMDLIVPTRHGPVPLTFLKKEFLASVHKELPALNDLEDIKNLPLNFVTQLTQSNAAFFEESPIFDSIYTDFVAQNGKFRFNDAYKVKIKKDWKEVVGYLSAYSPIEENNKEDYNWKELYLYSEPITSIGQERELVTWPADPGKLSKNPVVIKDTDQWSCDVEILDRKLNLNGDVFWALLFGYVLGQQSMNTTLSPEKEKELSEKLGKLDTYKEKQETQGEEPEPVAPKEESKKEVSEQDKFLDQWKHLKGYAFNEEKYKDNFWFVPWTRLFIPFAASEVPPVDGSSNAWLQMEIINVDTVKWTFKIKIHGGELHLGKSEGMTKELPLHTSSFDGIKKAFGPDIYKVPDIKWMSFDEQMSVLAKGSVVSDFDKYFWSTKFDSSKFTYTIGTYKGKEITHFGLYEPKAIDELVDTESGKLILYKIKVNANGTINVSGDSMSGNSAKRFPARDMDYSSFMLFVQEKKLQPKCKEQTQAITTKVKEDDEVPTTVRGFSINNIVGFFKNGVNKIKDGIKKYDEERTEDLTDVLTSKGKLWTNIWWILSPFSKISSSFESMGMDYYLERDGRIRKKVEKWTKVYEDYDYTKLYKEVIRPMLDWKVEIVPHYKIAAILLVHLKKGKWPYSRDPASTAQGKWIGKLLWKEHQERYLAIREKRIRDLEQNAHIYGGPWADQVKNELVELEMRYIVHVMDGRHMGVQDNDKTMLYFQGKYSQKFVSELETAYTWFFKQGTVDEWFNKARDNNVNFEFASVEYFRQLADRTQQAIPYLKVMATKAINATQWQVFETAVLAWILSGVFLNMTYSATQSYIQTICRTRGFIPWIFAKDINQQHKIQRLLDMFSNGGFTQETWYSPNDYSFRKNKWPWDFIKKFTARIGEGSRRNKLSKFLDLTWGNFDEKTLLDLHSDPKISPPDKTLLEEFISKTNEKDEGLDREVQSNMSSLTWSVLTKSQSVVGQMIKFDNWGFAGKDGDEIQNMKAFSKEMQKAIPKWTLTSQEQTKFFVNKFFNRFGERWFSWSKMTEFLKRLKWCKENKSSTGVKQVLRYSIVWEILSSLGSNNSNPPEELKWALSAWKDFFENNIDNILQPDVVVSCFGGSQYKIDYDNSQPQLEPRESCVNLLDRDLKQTSFLSLSPEQRKIMNARAQKLRSNKNYLNVSLYDLADRLYRSCGIANGFRDGADGGTKSSDAFKPSIQKSTWAKINNPEVMENVRRILENKPIEEENPDEYIPEYNEYDNNY